MQFNKYKSVDRNTSAKYLKMLFHRYGFDLKNSSVKQLFDIIIDVCENLEMPKEVSNINLANIMGNSSVHISRLHYEFQTEGCIVEFFSKIILDSENTDIDKFELLKLNLKILDIERKVFLLENEFI